MKRAYDLSLNNNMEASKEMVCEFNHINFAPCKIERIAGRSIHWIEVGSGPTIVLVHGGQAWAYAWRYQIEPLAAAGYRVIAPDLPGSGYSDVSSSADYSISALSRSLGDLLDKLKIQQAVFAASSEGGLPVLDLAIRCPERVAMLVLASSCGVPHDLPVLWRLIKWPFLGELMGLFVNETLVRSKLREAFQDKSCVTDELVSAYLDPLRRKGAWKANVKHERNWNPSFVEEQIHCIRCPTLVIWGEDDLWHPVRMAHEFGQRIQGSQVEILPACGHLPHEERPENFNELIHAFLSTHLYG